MWRISSSYREFVWGHIDDIPYREETATQLSRDWNKKKTEPHNKDPWHPPFSGWLVRSLLLLRKHTAVGKGASRLLARAWLNRSGNKELCPLSSVLSVSLGCMGISGCMGILLRDSLGINFKNKKPIHNLWFSPSRAFPSLFLEAPDTHLTLWVLP